MISSLPNLNLRIDNFFLNYVNEVHLFTSPIYKLFESRFDNIELRYQYLEQKEFNKLKQSTDYPIISLDPLIRGDYDLGISRLFTNMGKDLICFTHRPECPEIFQQLKQLPRGKIVVLYDHDMHKDASKLLFIKKLLFNHKLIPIPEFDVVNKNTMYLDIRDFIYRYRLGGLVVLNENMVVERQPLLYPFVDTLSKYGLDLEFSIEMWKINIDFHSQVSKDWIAEEQCKKYLAWCEQKLKE